MDPSQHHLPFQNVPSGQAKGRLVPTSNITISANKETPENVSSKITTSELENCPRELYSNYQHHIPASDRDSAVPGHANFSQPYKRPIQTNGPISYFQAPPTGHMPTQHFPMGQRLSAQKSNEHHHPQFGTHHPLSNHHSRSGNTEPNRTPIRLPPVSEMMPKRIQSPAVKNLPEVKQKQANYTVPTPKSLTKYPQSSYGHPSQTRTPAVFGSSLPVPSLPPLAFSANSILSDTTPRGSQQLTGNWKPTKCSDKLTNTPDAPLPKSVSASQSFSEKASNVDQEAVNDKSPKKLKNAVAISNEEVYKECGRLSGHELSISAVKFSACGSYLASSSADKTVRVWETGSLMCVRVLQGHELGINDISWSSDSIFLASASDDKTLKIFSVVEGVCVRTLRGHTHYVFCCAYNPQGSMILSGSFDESLRLWNAVTGICMKVMPAHTDPVTAVDFNRDGSLFASGAYDGFVRIWEASNGRCCATLKTPDYAPVTYLRYSPNGKWLLTSSLDGFVRIWCTRRNSIVKEYSGHTNDKYCVAVDFSVTQEHYIISGSEDGNIFVWDLQKKHIVQIIEGHSQAVLALDCNPRKSLFATGSIESDTDIRIWKHV